VLECFLILHDLPDAFVVWAAGGAAEPEVVGVVVVVLELPLVGDEVVAPPTKLAMAGPGNV